MYLLIFSQFPFIIRGTDASKEVPKVLFQYLDRQMLFNCRLVCKDWRNYIDLNTIISDFWYSQLPNSEELPFFLADGLMKCRNDTHLSKGSSGRKQKCTQCPTPFSGTVFYALSHGAIHFVQGVSFTNLEMEVFWLAVEEFQPTRKRFLKLTLRTKWITPSERALKTVPENGVGNCVHFCLRSLGALERCD